MAVTRQKPAPDLEEKRLDFKGWERLRSNLAAGLATWLSPDFEEEAERESLARTICAAAVETHWLRQTSGDRGGWLPWGGGAVSLSLPARRQVREVAGALEGLSVIESSYLLGTLYTSLLPPDLRARRGAFYTPPVLAERLLDLAAAQGVDWAAVKALDPACGGGAFLVPLANRVLGDHRVRCLEPEESLTHLEHHLAGIELDPFAAWMTQVFLRLLTYPLRCLAGRFPDIRILEGDALEAATGTATELGRFDLVVGNPPYGRVSLRPEQRRAFGRSLYGHANAYGLFLDAALRWRKPSGLIAFVTPTSFLGGKYFSRLRNLLLQEAPPLVIDVLEARTGVFDLVQQETCLAVFGPNASRSTVVHHLCLADRGFLASRAGDFELPTTPGSPWLLPRTARQASLAERASCMRTRLHHLGYRAATGPLVWNRHKEQLRTRKGPDTFPLIWAEAVRPNRFAFEYRSRAHAPFFAIREGQEHLLDGGPCVLVQRTTAKEQRRRLVACAIPPDHFDCWGRVVVENHVNVLRTTGADPVAPAALAAVLNTEAVDQVFRCLSGTVAVSATELHALPLPPRSVFDKVAGVLEPLNGRPLGAETAAAIENLVAEAFGVKVL